MVHVDVEYSETITEQGTSLFTPISGEPKPIYGEIITVPINRTFNRDP